MWTCGKCNRVFQTKNQSHMCVVKDVGELFIGRPDELVLAWDTLTQAVMEWQPNVYSASTKSIVYISKKAWLIIKPLRNDMEVKFYNDTKIASSRVKKYTDHSSKIAHHIRVKKESEVDQELIDLLKKGYLCSIS